MRPRLAQTNDNYTHTGMGAEGGVGGYWSRYLGTRNRENRRQKYRENRSLQMTTIGAQQLIRRYT